MNGPSFSMRAALGFGWQATWAHLGFFIVLMIVVGVLEVVPGAVANALARSSPLLSALLRLVGMVLSLLMSIGLIHIALRFVDQQSARLGDLFARASVFFPYLAVSLLVGIIVGIGLVLLVIPGIYLGLRFQFAPYLVVDRGIGPLAALAQSGDLTRGVKLRLLGFDLLLVLAWLVGALVLIVGLLVAMPTIILATAHVYRQLERRAVGTPAGVPT
jgi:uncharacterized membrane protein